MYFNNPILNKKRIRIYFDILQKTLCINCIIEYIKDNTCLKLNFNSNRHLMQIIQVI